MLMSPTYGCLLNQNLWSCILASEILTSALHDFYIHGTFKTTGARWPISCFSFQEFFAPILSPGPRKGRAVFCWAPQTFSAGSFCLSRPQAKSVLLRATGISPMPLTTYSETWWPTTDSCQLVLTSELGYSHHLLSPLQDAHALQVRCCPGPAQLLQSRFSYFLPTLYITKMPPTLQSLPQHWQMVGRSG